MDQKTIEVKSPAQVMEPRIVDLSPKKMTGLHLQMSYNENKTPLLWKSFMPKRGLIKNRTDDLFYSLQVFPPGYFQNFNPAAIFEKWALVEVSSFMDIPEGMQPFELQGGLYAVFHHKGADHGIFNYIYTKWVPGSGYFLDNRPHFEVLSAKYKVGDPDSEEDIWIPIKNA